uniref:Chalcone--flavanone isomerase n=1 Tax=Tradescantia hirsutiflora TaxID=428262 RepID=A0A1D8BEK9_9LILI|nr:chalcone-flavanone isomerase CHI3C [Tradescantia hirsutiflora]
MKNNWPSLKFPDFDARSPYNFPSDIHLSQGFAVNVLSQFASLVDNSFQHSNDVYASGSLAVQEALKCICKLGGSFSIWLSTRPSSGLLHKLSHEPLGSISSSSLYSTQLKDITSGCHTLAKLQFCSASSSGQPTTSFLSKIANFSLRRIWKELERHHVSSMMSLAAAFVPPVEAGSSKALSRSIAMESVDESISGLTNQQYKEEKHKGCPTLIECEPRLAEDTIEPKTGIKFPALLEDNFSMTNGVLVGIGSRSMRIIKFKSLKLYAFGLYVHPDSICEKLGPKYASVPMSELKNRLDFMEDLLRENICMSVRLVVSCNGLKINSVRSAFEKSLRNRLQKMNPDTDYHCLSVFGSCFTEDIPLPVGTTIDFRQTADGQLITEIGGKHVGAVQSKDLCRAFFDMYIGDIPVSVQAKEEIAQNVAGLVKRC